MYQRQEGIQIAKGLYRIWKIDAIKNGDVDDFEGLSNSYNAFIQKVKKEIGNSIDATYGIKGKAASWGKLEGGAGQIVTSFSGDILKKQEWQRKK